MLYFVSFGIQVDWIHVVAARLGNVYFAIINRIRIPDEKSVLYLST